MLRKFEVFIPHCLRWAFVGSIRGPGHLEKRRSPDRHGRQVRRQDTGAAHRCRRRRHAQFDAIQEIKTDQELHVSLKGGKTAVGPVTTTDGKIEIATKTAGTVEAPKDDVTLIRNDAEQTAYDKSLHPGLMHGWNGGANVGFSLARGNSQTENLALAFNAVHPTLNDKITLYASSINTKNNLADTGSTVANLVQGGLRYDRNMNPRVFVFGAADFMSNALQFLDLRQVYTGGFGFHAIKSDATTLDFLGGLNYTHETYSNGTENLPVTIPPTFVSYGQTNSFVALTLGEELDAQTGKEHASSRRISTSSPICRTPASTAGPSISAP